MNGNVNKPIFALPTAVYAGKGCLDVLRSWIAPGDSVLIVTDRGVGSTQAAKETIALVSEAASAMEMYDGVEPNPGEETVMALAGLIREKCINRVIALGGGSPLDAAKAAAAFAPCSRPLEDYQWNNVPFEKPAVPLAALPTTAGTGSEVTGVAVIASRNLKKGIRGPSVFPEIALLDPVFTAGMPPFITAITGMDALTHAVEALVGLAANPFTDALAEKAVGLVGRCLVRAYRDGSDGEARAGMAMASCLAGLAMDQSGLGIVHAMSGPLCSYLHLSHGLANALLLKTGMEYNLSAAREKFARIGELLDSSGEKGVLQLPVDKKAEAAVELTGKLIHEIGLTDELEKLKKEKPDLGLYGENAARMFMIGNNPRPAGAAECGELFRKLFSP